MKEFILQPVADFGEQLGEREIVTVGIGTAGNALLLAVEKQHRDSPNARYVQKGWASFARSKVKPYPLDLLEFAPEFSGEISLQNVEESHPYIQPLSWDETLIVAARCNYRNKNPEQNAAIYGADGVLKRRFVMGDGIQHVQVAHDGTIWAAYFDEGVFGNYGWNQPLGASGVLRFDANGEILWRFEPKENCGFIADCYAMNVAHDATWLCYYTDFPIVRIKPDGTMRGWKNEIGGAYALATDNHRVALFGGYQEQRHRCVVQEFGDDKMVRGREIKFTLPEGEIPEQMRVTGCGSILHFFIGTVWYQFDLAEADA